MAGLRDIGPITSLIKIGDVELTVRGLSANNLLYLLQRFEGARALFSTNAKDMAEKLQGDAAPTLIQLLPEAVWATMAIATGTTNEAREADEKAASELTLGDQCVLLNAIMDVTFREGVGPLVRIMDRMTSVMAVKAPETEAAATPSTNVSPPRSPAAFHLELPPEKLGRIRLAS